MAIGVCCVVGGYALRCYYAEVQIDAIIQSGGRLYSAEDVEKLLRVGTVRVGDIAVQTDLPYRDGGTSSRPKRLGVSQIAGIAIHRGTRALNDEWPKVDLRVFPRLQYVSLHSFDVPFDPSDIALPSDIYAIDVSFSPIGPAGKDFLRRCEKTEFLACTSCEFEDDDISCIASLPRLKTLDLSSSNITDRSLFDLCHAPVLERLSLVSTSVSIDAIKSLATIHTLTELNLTNVCHDRTWIDVARDKQWVEVAETLQSLRRLDASACGGAECELNQAFIQLPHPEDAARVGIRYGYRLTEGSPRNPARLEVLVLRGRWIDDDTVRAFSGIESIEELDLSWSRLDGDLKGLPSLRKLSVLRAEGLELASQRAALLKEHPDLRIEP